MKEILTTERTCSDTIFTVVGFLVILVLSSEEDVGTTEVDAVERRGATLLVLMAEWNELW